MARTPKGYWEKRSTDLMLRLEKGTEKTIDNLIKVYNQATKNINKEINNIFRNYANETGLSRKVLTSMLNKRETDTYYRNLLNTIEKINNEDVRKKLLAKYNAPAYSYRINRFQALQDNIDVEIAKIADIEQTITKERYVDTIKEGYYHNIYDIQKGLGYGFNFSKIDTKTINLMLNEKWTENGNFSSRIWKNADKLSNYLKINFTADTMSGKSISAMSQELSATMNIGLYKSTRLIRTEVNHFANESEMLSYEELGIEKYRFVATLDNVTCKHCAALDNKVFYVKDRQAGKNYPPIHPNDRCTTVAEFDDDRIEDLKRRAIDEKGNLIKVPQEMGYNEWCEKYVTNIKNDDIIGKADYIRKNKITDNRVLDDKVKNVIQIFPKYIQEYIMNTPIQAIGKGKNNHYLNGILYLLNDATEEEIIHEVGHIIEEKLDIAHDNKYQILLKKNIGKIDVFNNSIGPIDGYDPDKYEFLLTGNNFVSEYQRRVYNIDINKKDRINYQNGEFNYNVFRDYFPEGLKYYFADRQSLRNKNIDLYKYIKGVLHERR